MSVVDAAELDKINEDVKARGYVDREHLTKFLSLVPTNEAEVIIQEVQTWLKALHDNPEYQTVTFPQGDINAVLGDLDSYGRVQPLTVQRFKQDSNKAVAQTS
jgi:hypothetical protein